MVPVRAFIIYTLTANLYQFLLMLTSTGIVALSALLVLDLVHKTNNKNFWPLVYPLVTANVIVWSFILCS
ncbi:hypothetical protein ES702_05800 [subsurface metagenome]